MPLRTFYQNWPQNNTLRKGVFNWYNKNKFIIKQKNMCECHAGGKCSCMHHKMVPLMLVLLGLAFLLKAWGILSAGFVDVAWPVLLILIGLQKMMGGVCKCCDMPMPKK